MVGLVEAQQLGEGQLEPVGDLRRHRQGRARLAPLDLGEHRRADPSSARRGRAARGPSPRAGPGPGRPPAGDGRWGGAGATFGYRFCGHRSRCVGALTRLYAITYKRIACTAASFGLPGRRAVSGLLGSLPRLHEEAHTQLTERSARTLGRRGAARSACWRSSASLILRRRPGCSARPPRPARPVARHTAARPARVGLRHLRISTRCLINRARRRHGLRPLRINSKLRRVATVHSRADGQAPRSSPTARPRRRSRAHRATSRGPAPGLRRGDRLRLSPGRVGEARLPSPALRSSSHSRRDPHRALPRRSASASPVATAAGGGRKCATYTVDFGVSLDVSRPGAARHAAW